MQGDQGEHALTEDRAARLADLLGQREPGLQRGDGVVPLTGGEVADPGDDRGGVPRRVVDGARWRRSVHGPGLGAAAAERGRGLVEAVELDEDVGPGHARRVAASRASGVGARDGLVDPFQRLVQVAAQLRGDGEGPEGHAGGEVVRLGRAGGQDVASGGGGAVEIADDHARAMLIHARTSAPTAGEERSESSIRSNSRSPSAARPWTISAWARTTSTARSASGSGPAASSSRQRASASRVRPAHRRLPARSVCSPTRSGSVGARVSTARSSSAAAAAGDRVTASRTARRTHSTASPARRAADARRPATPSHPRRPVVRPLPRGNPVAR